MTHIDRLNRFGLDVAALTDAATTAVVGDVIDLGNTTNYPGDGEPVWLVVECTEQMTTAGVAGTATFALVSSAASALTSPRTHLSSLAIVTDDTTAIAVGIEAGTDTYLPNIAPTTAQTGITDPDKVVNRPPILCAPLPSGEYLQYLGVTVTAATADMTAGKVNAYLCKDAPQRWRGLPNAI